MEVSGQLHASVSVALLPAKELNILISLSSVLIQEEAGWPQELVWMFLKRYLGRFWFNLLKPSGNFTYDQV
jgi:hypothetical protein